MKRNRIILYCAASVLSASLGVSCQVSPTSIRMTRRIGTIAPDYNLARVHHRGQCYASLWPKEQHVELAVRNAIAEQPGADALVLVDISFDRDSEQSCVRVEGCYNKFTPKLAPRGTR